MNNPVRLEKRGETMKTNPILTFLDKHAVMIVFICTIILFALLIVLIAVVFADTSNTTHVPSMMDSGNYYYHLQDVI